MDIPRQLALRWTLDEQFEGGEHQVVADIACHVYAHDKERCVRDAERSERKRVAHLIWH